MAIEAPVLGQQIQESSSLNFKYAVIAVGVSAMQQLSGINAVLFYAPTIYHELGFAKNIAILAETLNSQCIADAAYFLRQHGWSALSPGDGGGLAVYPSRVEYWAPKTEIPENTHTNTLLKIHAHLSFPAWYPLTVVRK